MKKNVFISSTFKDLKEYRQEVWNIVEKYDLDVKGMESFGARSENALDTCLQEVRDSQIYIGIIGMVYGSVDSKTEKSYTHLEYEEAVNSGLDVFIYLIDDKGAYIKIENIDFKHHKKLVDFKSILKDKHHVDFFKTPQELGEKISNLLNTQTDSFVISRPKTLTAKIFRKEIQGNRYLFFLGYMNSLAYELWIADYESMYIPQYVNNCWITEVSHPDDRTRYDCEFDDMQGYRIVVPALNRTFDSQLSNISQSISFILSEQISKSKIIFYLKEKYTCFGEFEKEIIEELVNILELNHRLIE